MDENNSAVEEPSAPPRRIDLAAILERMDQSELVVALIAINPELEDILPDDDQIRQDVANVRQQLAERHLRLNDNPAQVGNVVQQHVHVHLWDEKTSERVRELGTAVVSLFQNLKDKLVEAKAKYLDGDGRDVISFEEAYAGFQVGLRGMADFITRRDRSNDTAGRPWPADAPDKASADPSDPKIKWWGYVLANFGAVPSREYLENLQLKRDAEKAVVRLASSAVDEVLDDDLEPVAAPAAPKPEPAATAPAATPEKTASGGGKTYSFAGRDKSEPEPTMDDFDGPPPPMDDAPRNPAPTDQRHAEMAANTGTTLPAPTENELTCLKLCLNYDTREAQLSDNYSNGGAAEFREALGWNEKQVAALIGSMEAKGYGSMDDEGVNGQSADIFWLHEDAVNMVFDMIEAEDETLYVVRSSTPNSPHYITSEAGKHTYNKGEAAQFPLDEAERLAGDHSDYAATKGYGYRYQIEEAGPAQAHQLRTGAALSR